ncbi:putative disease resistance protein At5g47280 [Prosopis cineraria]|uniref:putative disease resistance protein At5g47280 n=1 Tax=Prosopis cineraria TaxID=364024 RepID=UPI00240F75B6|nr:putative disease resistance protein At5g47280 [Prosopis cineraria]
MIAEAFVLKLLFKELWKKVEKGVKHESTAQNLKAKEKELSPEFEELEELARKANIPSEKTEELRKAMTQLREARLNYSQIQWWCYCCLAPCYQEELEKADKKMKDFLSERLPLENSKHLLLILCLLQTKAADQTDRDIGQPEILRSGDLDKISESTLPLNAPLMKKLKACLMMEGRDSILNLTGFAGSGKTTFAQRLCCDKDVRGWFNDIMFVSVGSIIESTGDILVKRLKDELHGNENRKAVLLVLDNVESSGSEEFVNQCLKEISSNSKSKILVTSRAAIQGLNSAEHMPLLGEDDAITLLSHFVQPIGTTSYNLPSHSTLRQVARGCGGFPIMIKIIGTDLRGKPIIFWHRLLKEWSQQGHQGLFAHLQSSLSISRDFESTSKFFMDLGLFPQNQVIPVAALVDMWVELYQQDEDGTDAMIHIYHLTAMNLADMVLVRRIGSDEDNYYDNHYLTQHYILRHLARKYSRQQEEAFERERLDIGIYGNDRPEWWPEQPQQRINDLGPTLQPIAARILSISTDQAVTPGWCNIQAAQAEVLILNLKTSEYTLPEFIKHMRNLKVLIVINYGFRRSTEFKNFELLRFLQSLRRIRLQHVSVPCLLESKNLHKLSLYKCEVKTAFENSSMEFSNAVPNLTELNIEFCEDLVKLPAEICNIVTLKKLSISVCRNFSELPREIEKLENLELLRISYSDEFRFSDSDEFKDMPEPITKLKRLKFLDISHCISLRKLPDDIGELQKLRNLYMSGCPIKELPGSVMNLTHLRRVICDEHSYGLWDVIKGFINFELDIQTTARGVTLRWFPGDFEGDKEIEEDIDEAQEEYFN